MARLEEIGDDYRRPSGARNKSSRHSQAGHNRPSHQRRHRHSPTRRSYVHAKCQSVSPIHSRSPSPRSWSGGQPSRRHHNHRGRQPLTLSDDSSDMDGEYEYEPIEALPATKDGHVPKVDEPLTGPENYHSWCYRLKWFFIANKLGRYVDGTITRPDPEYEPRGASNWKQNDAFACLIITTNVAISQLKHTNPCTTSHEMWKALKAVHEPRDHRTVINYIKILFRCSAEEGADIPKHLDMLKGTWERINLNAALGSEHFHILDRFFKIIIASSLPPSWDLFTEGYISRKGGFFSIDPKKQIGSQEFIGAIVSEYAWRETRALTAESSNTAFRSSQRANIKGKNPRINRFSQQPTTNRGRGEQRYVCRLCKSHTHQTDDCPRWNDIRCNYCHKPGHGEDDCWNKDKEKKPSSPVRGNEPLVPRKCPRRENAHRAR